MNRIAFFTLIFAALLFAMPAHAGRTWTKPHYTKRGTYVSGHYTSHRSHISHARRPRHK